MKPFYKSPVDFDDIPYGMDLLFMAGTIEQHRNYFDTAVFIINFIFGDPDYYLEGNDPTRVKDLLTIHAFTNDLDEKTLTRYVNDLSMF